MIPRGAFAQRGQITQTGAIYSPAGGHALGYASATIQAHVCSAFDRKSNDVELSGHTVPHAPERVFGHEWDFGLEVVRDPPYKLGPMFCSGPTCFGHYFS